MIDLDRLADDLGLDLPGERPEPARPSPPLGTAGIATRDELLHHLGAARALLEMMESAVTVNPGDDASFDALDVALSQRFAQANEALGKFRELRACLGTA